MGIDVYLRWKGQNESEEKKQYTGYRADCGNVGYLREAYHGGPYATKVFVPEGWVDSPELPKVPAKVLMSRVPAAVMISMYRHHLVYEQGHEPGVINVDSVKDAADISKALFGALSEIKSVKNQSKVHKPTKEQVKQVWELIKARKLPAYAMSFYDFAALAATKEAETGEPCEVIVSY